MEKEDLDQKVIVYEPVEITPEDPLRRYIVEVNRYPLLTREEEFDLAKQFKENHDPDAARRLVTAHLRLVVKIAMEYRTAYGNVLDLVQEGNVGLLRSIKTFDPDKGNRLSSYAAWWIRSYILKYILDNFRLIKIGTTQAQRSLFFNLMKEKKRIEAMGFKPDAKMIANRLNVTESEVQEMDQRLSESEYSLDAPVGESSQTFNDYLADPTLPIDESIDHANLQDVLHEKIKEFEKGLNERERKILVERLMSEVPLTLQQIADEYGISRERARQIEERIKHRLKDFFEKEGVVP